MVNSIWLLVHYIDQPGAFVGVEPSGPLALRCAYCRNALRGHHTTFSGGVGVTCPEPQGIGPFDDGQRVRIELGGRIFHGELIRFDDEPDLEEPGEWCVRLPVCSVRCNLLVRAQARADVVQELGRAPDVAWPHATASLDRWSAEATQSQAPERAQDLKRIQALAVARLERWIEACLTDLLLESCGWCGARLILGSVLLAHVRVAGDDTRRRRPAITAVRLADRLLPAMVAPGLAPDPWVCVLFCGRPCQEAARRAIEADRHGPCH